jgi:hypothetical protein
MKVVGRQFTFDATVGGILVATLLGGVALAQSGGPWGQGDNPAAKQADAIFPDYRFRDGETLARNSVP